MFFNVTSGKRKGALFQTGRKSFSNQPNSYADFCMGQLDLCDEEMDAGFNKNDSTDTPRRETPTKQLKSVP